MATATNVAMCQYNNGVIDSRGWATNVIFHVGYNYTYKINRVVVVRFTLANAASSVSIPLQCYEDRSYYAMYYGLGNDPAKDASMTNKTGSSGSLGTVAWSSTYQTQTVKLTNLEPGTYYLYIWTSSTSVDTQGDLHARGTAHAGVSYVEMQQSSLSASNGTLGTALTLEVTRRSVSYTHTIKYDCGSASETICTNSTAESLSWIPPLSLASQNVNGTSVVVKFTITTYNNDLKVGSETATISCAIPESVKPSFDVVVSDAMNYKETFGGYVQSKSKLHIVVDASSMYNATIASVKVTANGETHTTSDVETGALKNSGANIIHVEIMDSRGRTASGDTTVDVLAYSAPAISRCEYNRCDADGTDNQLGEYAEITFSNAITPLNNKNTATYILEVKKTSDSEYEEVDMNSFNGLYSVDNGKVIFAAESGSSYDVRLTVSDAFGFIVSELVVSTGFAIMHWLPRGLGMGIGKIAEHEGGLDMGFDIHMNEKKIYGMFPVGAVYAEANNEDPSSKFGGTWSLVNSTAIPGVYFWKRTL